MRNADPIDPRTRRACLAILGVAVLLFALLRVPYLSLPLERDEGEYAYIAQRMLAGDVPYRDAFDQKPPGVFVAYAAAFLSMGASTESIHLFLYLWTALTAFPLYAFARRLASPLAAAFGVLVFAIASIDPRMGATAANTEIFMLLPLVASAWALLRALEGEGARWWIACGALAGAACWFKQVGVANVGFVAAAALVAAPRSPATSLRRLGLLAFGAALVSAPILLAFWATGAWGAFVDSVLLHNLVYSARVSPSHGFANLRGALGHLAPSFAVFWLMAAPALAWPGLVGSRRSWVLLVGFAAASFAGVSTGFYFRNHYFLQLAPALAVLAGITLAAVARSALGRGGPLSWGAVAGLALLVAVPPIAANRGFLFAGSPVATSRRIYGFNPFPESERIARYIRETSEPGDSIYVVGSEPQIFFHAERRSATRYIYFYPLTAEFPGALERQRGVLAEVDAARPRYVVWVNIATSLLFAPGTERWLFDETWKRLARDYRLEFVAEPRKADAEFEFFYGDEARRLLLNARREAAALPWIAVYRRAS